MQYGKQFLDVVDKLGVSQTGPVEGEGLESFSRPPPSPLPTFFFLNYKELLRKSVFNPPPPPTLSH